MFGVAIVPSVLLALGMAASPESPRWLFQVVKNVRSYSRTDFMSAIFIVFFSAFNWI